MPSPAPSVTGERGYRSGWLTGLRLLAFAHPVLYNTIPTARQLLTEGDPFIEALLLDHCKRAALSQP